MSSSQGDAEAGSPPEPNKFIMLNKKERILIRVLLRRDLTSEAGREFIAKKFGKEYLDIGERLLNEMGGDAALPL